MCAYKIDRTFHLQLCTLRQNYLRICQLAVTTLHQLSTGLARCQHSGALDLPGDEADLLKCADQLNELAHQYTLLADPTSSSTSLLSSPSRDLPSDRAMEVLYTLCLVLAYAIQNVANILSDTRSSDNRSVVEQNDAFDIDPLLIPLLFDQQQDDVQQNCTVTKRSTFINVFRTSTRMILEHLVNNLRGRDLQSLEVSTHSRWEPQQCTFTEKYLHTCFISSIARHLDTTATHCSVCCLPGPRPSRVLCFEDSFSQLHKQGIIQKKSSPLINCYRSCCLYSYIQLSSQFFIPNVHSARAIRFW